MIPVAPGRRAALSRRRRRAAIAAALIAGACASARPPGSAAIERIEFSGNQALARADLERHLLTEVPTWKPWKTLPALDEPTLAEDMLRIQGLYRRHGYYQARAEYTLRWNPERSAAAVEVRIEEGPPVVLADWSAALDALPEDDAALRAGLLEGLALRSGEVFSLDAYQDTKRALRERLADRGYPRAELEGGAEVDLAKHEARVAWRVEPGPRVELGETKVSGLERVDEALIRRELSYAPGDAYSARALRDTQKKIYDLGLFQSVRVRSRPESEPGPDTPPAAIESRWPVGVDVVERPPRSVRAGIGYGSEERVRVMLGWQRRNFLGQARLLELTARYSSLLESLEASLTQPRVLDGRFALRAAGELQREHTPSFDANRARATLRLTRPLFGAWKGMLGYGLEWNEVSDVSRATEQELEDPEETLLLSYLELGVKRSSVQDSLAPRRGSSFELSSQFAPGFLGSQSHYLKNVADWRVYRPLFGAVLATRLRLGSIQPLPGTQPEEVPLVVRFFSGGSNSVRGFGYRELGPLDDQGEALGGTSLAEGSLELRFPLWEKLGGVAFLDAGQVDLEPYNWKLDQIYYATGFGLRYTTPIGPLRVDFGWVLNPEEAVDRFRIHLAVGHAF